MTDHTITVVAVYQPGGQPYAAECSCGLRWHTPEHWPRSAVAAAGSDWTEEAKADVAAKADEEAKDTYRMWKELHPTVPGPRPRKVRVEVVRRLTECWLGDMEDATVRMGQLEIAFAATRAEQRAAMHNFDDLGGLQLDGFDYGRWQEGLA